jgi:hypothetical protein
MCDRTTSEWGVRPPGLAWAILGEATTQSTHKAYNTIYYISVNILHIRFTYWSFKRLPPQKVFQKIEQSYVEALSLIAQCIPIALEENGMHRCSKPADPSKAPNPHRVGPPTGMPHRHRRKWEEDPHQHVGDNKSKAWATMLSKTYPSWSNDHD